LLSRFFKKSGTKNTPFSKIATPKTPLFQKEKVAVVNSQKAV
jgi:hypothetical protein